MSLTRVSRKLEFDSAHRVLKHESKCAHLHGHRYTAIICVTAPELDALGRVVDFGVIKSLVGKWIDDNWDHNILLHPEDPLLKALRIADSQATRYQVDGRGKGATPVSDAVFGGDKKPYVFPAGINPTAENIAMVLCSRAQILFNDNGAAHIRVGKVRVYETPNCYADYLPNQ